MTKADFRKLFMRALSTAAANVDKAVTAPISRSFSIELHAPSSLGRLLNIEEAVDHLYLSEDRFYKIIDVAIKELRANVSIVFVRVSGHPPVAFGQTCDPVGLGPFKHMLASTLQDRRVQNVNATEPLKTIVGEKLSGVTFVLDYWQLQFDGPTVTVFTRIEVHFNGSIARDGDDQFRNRLCSQIGKIVQSANVTQGAIAVTFMDQSSISISLHERDHRGPEAALLHGPDGRVIWVV